MKKILIVIALLAAGAAFWLIKSDKKADTTSEEKANQEQQAGANDSVDLSAINKDIEAVDIGSFDQEFQELGEDLKGL